MSLGAASGGWRRAKGVFLGALERPAGERDGYLDAVCAGDGSLRAEVASLLAAHADAEADGDADGDGDGRTAFGRPGPRRPARRCGQRRGEWLLGALLGEGGMGAVYRARRDGGGEPRHAAVKVIHDQLDGGGLAHRFRLEQEILAGIDHPHVCRFLDAGEGYLAMELVEGLAIDAHCRELPRAGRLELFAAVCDAVHAVHERGVVHLDIKARNVLVTRDGAPKLLDFGIAARLGEGARAARGAGLRGLTPECASPEQIRGDDVGPPSDVHALGLLLYRLLADRHVYGGGSVAAILRAVLTREPCLRGLEGPLRQVVRTALDKDPARRHPSAASLAAAVRNVP